MARVLTEKPMTNGDAGEEIKRPKTNAMQARVAIRGVRPLLWHWFGPEAIPLEKQEKSGVPGNDPQEWRKTVLLTPDGQLYVEASYVFGAIREGAKNIKKNRGSIMPMVASTLQVIEELILIDRFLPDPLPTDKTAPVYLDIRGVRNPSTKGRNVRYRVAAGPGWATSFTLRWDPTIVSRGEMQAAVIDGGRLAGIGNGRAIGMGRFEVESFQIVEAA